MSEEDYDVELASSLTEVVVKMVEEDCLYTGLNLEDPETRDSIIAGLKNAASYFEQYTKLLH